MYIEIYSRSLNIKKNCIAIIKMINRVNLVK